MLFLQRWAARFGILTFLVLVGIVIGIYVSRPGVISSIVPEITEDVIDQTIITTLENESPRSILVTGEMEISAQMTVENTRYLFPDYFEEMLSLGTTRSSVRLPGRVLYGVDLAGLTPEHITLRGENIIQIDAGEISIQAVEADLANMEIETEVGWARLSSMSGRETERAALIKAQEALRELAVEHLNGSDQPRRNTENALQEILAPVLAAKGIENPQILLFVGPTVIIPPEG